MKKTMLLAAMLALTVLAIGAPAAMADNDRQDNRFEDCFFFDGVLICDDDFDRDFVDGERFNFDGELDQDVEQDAESGDVDQSFDVSQTGDNSNQCVGVQGVANTGNAQNVTDVTQLGAQEEDDLNDFDGERFFSDDFGFFLDGFDRFDGDGGDLEFEEVGSTIEVSPTNTTSCDQQVNQAATATG